MIHEVLLSTEVKLQRFESENYLYNNNFYVHSEVFFFSFNFTLFFLLCNYSVGTTMKICLMIRDNVVLIPDGETITRKISLRFYKKKEKNYNNQNDQQLPTNGKAFCIQGFSSSMNLR